MEPLPIVHKNNFDLLRLAGAVMVIFSHSYDIVGRQSEEIVNQLTNKTIEASGIGLAIFFFISGYFVTQSAVLTKTFFLFVKKRILRIYPALIVLVLVSVFIAGPLLTCMPVPQYFSTNASWLYLFTATGLRIRTFLPGVFTTGFFENGFNASLWSIAVEIKLYLSVSLFLLTGIIKNKKIYCYISLLIVIACLYTLAFIDQSFLQIRQLNFISLFFLGSFIYTSSLDEKYLMVVWVVSSIVYIIFRSVMAATPLLLIILGIGTYFIGFTKKVIVPLSADISYGLYIFAFPIQQIVFKLSGFNRSVIVNLLGTFIILIPVAFLSWYLIEKPFILEKQLSCNL